MVARTLVSFAKRTPLIKFRYGGVPRIPAGGESAAASKTATNQASAKEPQAKIAKKPKKSTAPAIEDWQLPPRYWRKPIDPTEMEYINNGGVP